MFYYRIKRYLCGSGRAWAVRQRPVRLVTGHPNSVEEPSSLPLIVVLSDVEGPLVARNPFLDEQPKPIRSQARRCPLVLSLGEFSPCEPLASARGILPLNPNRIPIRQFG